jgi:hypothetical protein
LSSWGVTSALLIVGAAAVVGAAVEGATVAAVVAEESLPPLQAVRATRHERVRERRKTPKN